MLKCKYCGNEMRLDDTDRFRKQVFAKYYACDSCNCSCIVNYFMGIPAEEHWHSENNGEIKDEIIDILGDNNG